MSTAVAPSSRRPIRVLADLIPGALTRDIVLVLAATAFLTVAGQVAIPLPFTPVPLSLSTFAVILSAAALGPVRAASSSVLYLALGVAGLPMFASHASGWDFASFGYIVGNVVVSIVVGVLARRRADRSVLSTIALASIGSLGFYVCGVPWLMAFIGADLPTGLALGALPFLIGDLIKIVVVALILPSAWKLVGTRAD
ncbi:biotin transporter BioY [Glaciihabitans sp. dw_435]|uniref:biotin transporter BioY n=1 Tax=Glaciihabitans sp. dw_435 TaxID=2720081 RepID=UPI001BD639AA|nr:biotin transporter BioY [Glaciihabitans sp. dw_435]